MLSVEIAGRKIGPNHPAFVVAEAGVNHNGNIDLARRLVDVAVRARADAVKFQTFVADKVMTRNAPKAGYQKRATDPHESQLEMVKRLELSFDEFRHIKAYCDDRDILFLSTPFDETSADFLDELGVPAFKVPSGEVVNHLFLEHVARKGKPIIMSTGMCYLSEVDEAIRVISNAGGSQLVLLHCVSNYPADPADGNLLAMQTMTAAFGVPVGYSDHTVGMAVGLAAVALGACVIEKHFTLDRGLPGPDHRASMEPDDLCAFIESIRTVQKALGDGRKIPVPAEEDTRLVARRSLVLTRDLAAGQQIDRTVLTALRPTGGIGPDLSHLVIGRQAARALKAGAILSWQDLK
jgi:N,N'-diacetyllegionaminate synthase